MFASRDDRSVTGVQRQCPAAYKPKHIQFRLLPRIGFKLSIRTRRTNKKLTYSACNPSTATWKYILNTIVNIAAGRRVRPSLSGRKTPKIPNPTQTYKPGSVHRRLPNGLSFIWDAGHPNTSFDLPASVLTPKNRWRRAAARPTHIWSFSP